MSNKRHFALGFAAAAGVAAGASASSTTVGFENGPEGWSINGADAIDPIGGNPGAHLPIEIYETFGISVRNETNAKFIGDYTARGPVRIGVDFKVDFIRFFGQDVTRDIVLELRDYDNPAEGYPYTSVWFNAGELPSNEDGWTRFEFDVVDVMSASLPAGWGGAGAEDPETFEPILPAHRSWTDVLASVDEISFTTFVPGFFYGFTDFKVSVDNITITPIPAPGAGAALCAAGLLGGLRRRR